MSPELLELLTRLALNDEDAVGLVMSGQIAGEPRLYPKTVALVRIASLAGREAPTASFQVGVDHARAAGADDNEIVDTVRAVSALIGSARIEATIPTLIAALDLDGADSMI